MVDKDSQTFWEFLVIIDKEKEAGEGVDFEGDFCFLLCQLSLIP